MRTAGAGGAHAASRALTVRAAAAAVVLLTAAGPAVCGQTAAEGVPASGQSAADSSAVVVPGKALLRSAIVPGWGQFYVKKPFKGILVGAGAAWVVSRAIRAHSEVSDLVGQRSGTTDPLLEDEIERWRGERSRWVLWTLGAWVFAMLDAYVDAHLYDFDRVEPDFTPPPVMYGGGPAPPVYLGVRVPLGRMRR